MKIAPCLLTSLLAISPASATLSLFLSDGTGALHRTTLDGTNPARLHGSLGEVLPLTGARRLLAP